MAPTLTSNSFLLTTAPHSGTHRKNLRPTVFAKKAGIFSKKSDEEGGESSSPFRFDFGKLPDVRSLVPVVSNPSQGLSFGQRRKDTGTVFVAGATGQLGIRIAQTLLRQGFNVRAGVPDLGAAQELARLAVSYKIISNDESKRLNAVASTFSNAESIAKAIGNASKVVVTIGTDEDGPSAQVTTSDALQVIEAAQLAKVGHVAIVYDGSSGETSTYNVLDGITSFFNNLFAKSQPLTITEFLQNVVETDVSYTLIKTKLTDDFSSESSYNVVVSAEGSAGSNDYKVSRSKIASLVADVFSNTAVAENKVVEVYADPSAPSKTVDELFSAIPEDGRRKAYAEALSKAKAEEEASRESAKELEKEAKTLEQEEAPATSLSAETAGESVENFLNKAKGLTSGISWENLSSQLKSAKKLEKEAKTLKQEEAPATSLSAETAGESVENFLNKAKDLTSGISWENLSSQLKSAVQKPDEEPKVQLATVRGQAKARSLPSLKAVVKSPARKPAPSKSKVVPKPKGKVTEPKKETRKVFGGLFKQETIYIDDD